VRLWNNPTGVAERQGRVIRFGIPGQADLSGILRDGRRLEIEVKSARGVQSPEQVSFEAMITKFGGVYILARSVSDAVQGIDRAANDRGARGVGPST
jgi:hypothetical protein